MRYSILAYPVGINPTMFTPNLPAKLARYDIRVTTIICVQTIKHNDTILVQIQHNG